MAYTMSTTLNTVFGDKRVWMGHVTLDAAATSVVIPGATFVDHVLDLTPVTTAGCGVVVIVPNQGPVGTSILGSVALTSAASTRYQMTVVYH